MRAEIITIGDEILIGQIVDTNSTFLCKALNEIGIEVYQITSVHDERNHILQALEQAASRVSLVLITGGLGPTKDDITKSCFLEFFDDQLILHEPTKKHVEHLFATYIQKAPSDQNLNQALIPAKAQVLPNVHGTAPGLWMQKEETVYVAMPGVPFEMKHLMNEEVLPRLITHFDRPFIYHKTLMTYGMGESSIADRIDSWAEALPQWVKLAYLPSFGKVRIRLSAAHSDEGLLHQTIDGLMAELKDMLSDIAVGFEGKTSMQEQIAAILIEKGQSLGLVESCTGGRIAQEITALPGASAYFKGGIIPYDTGLKTSLLEVDPQEIKNHSTVSLEIAEALALGGQKLNADYVIATTGIAGPTKGDGRGEVGRVCIAIAGPEGVIKEEYLFGKARERIIQKAVDKALELLLKEISKTEFHLLYEQINFPKFAACLKNLKVQAMSRVCELTGKKAMVGNNVSHAMNKTKRKFNANLVKKRFYIPEEDKWITLKVSTSALKTINKKGIAAVLKEARENGFLNK